MPVEAGGILKDIVEVLQGFLGIRSVCPFYCPEYDGFEHLL